MCAWQSASYVQHPSVVYLFRARLFVWRFFWQRSKHSCVLVCCTGYTAVLGAVSYDNCVLHSRLFVRLWLCPAQASGSKGFAGMSCSKQELMVAVAFGMWWMQPFFTGRSDLQSQKRQVVNISIHVQGSALLLMYCVVYRAARDALQMSSCCGI
jgi:hypothetical protein